LQISIGAEKEVISFNGVIREGDPLNWRADTSRILRLGYQKKVSIQDGLDNYVQWVRSQDLINDGTLPKEI